MSMTMRKRLTKSLIKLGEQQRNKVNYDLQDELCDTMAEAYDYEPFEKYAKQLEVKPLVQIVNHWIRQIFIDGVETSEDDKVGEFEKYIRIPGEFKSVLKLASNLGQPQSTQIRLSLRLPRYS